MSPEYIEGWNSVITALTNKDKTQIDFFLEILRDSAHRGLLYYKNIDSCQAVLDSTSYYQLNDELPSYM